MDPNDITKPTKPITMLFTLTRAQWEAWIDATGIMPKEFKAQLRGGLIDHYSLPTDQDNL